MYILSRLRLDTAAPGLWKKRGDERHSAWRRLPENASLEGGTPAFFIVGGGGGLPFLEYVLCAVLRQEMHRNASEMRTF